MKSHGTTNLTCKRQHLLDVTFMILVATNESMSRPKYTYRHQPLMTFISLLLSVTLVGSFAFLAIIRPVPRWAPQYVIPIVGMLLGNCINGVSLTVNNVSTQIMEGGRREIELYLSFGASGWESMRRLVKTGVGSGVTPLLNSLNVIGLVSIPGKGAGFCVTFAARHGPHQFDYILKSLSFLQE